VRVVDDAILAAVRAAGVTVFEGHPQMTKDGNKVTYPVPYAVFYSNVGDDDNPRLSGRKGRRSVFCSFIYVGGDPRQAKWAGERIRNALQGKRLTVVGHPQRWLCDLEESQRVRRDDDAIQPDGSPLFYGVDNFALSIALSHGGI